MRYLLIFVSLFANLLTIAHAESLALPDGYAAVSDDQAVADRAIERLRSRGAAGLQELLDAHAAELAKGPRKDDAWTRLAAAIDAVAGQKDAYAAKLFWYTDLDQAKAAAQREGKPILSLRLLGNLDCDLSCANSRFFRTTLYPDPAVSKLLREKFVLHWKSERPVPVVTIDFGDGRTIKRAITGNSVHYVLRADGRPIDALPGLYSAAAFVRGLEDALTMVNESDAAMRDRHVNAAQRLDAMPQSAEPVRLSPQVVAMIKAKNPPRAEDAMRRAVSKTFVEDPLVKLVRNLENSIAQDTLSNEYVLHRQIHQWFAAAPINDMERLNNRVYSELFLTPRSDPWLGLAPSDTFSGLENEGLTATAAR